jgi:glycosyltransferase involved in cell wall biosynthesis
LVEYLGEIGFDEKVELLSHAKINLHPTNFREPFGLTVLEAAYCGTPTLAIARGSMPELIEFGRTGIWVEDFVEGFHHLEECFAMDRTYVASRARQLFNYHTMAKGYIQAYKAVLQQSKSTAPLPQASRFSRWLETPTPRLKTPLKPAIHAAQPRLRNSRS